MVTTRDCRHARDWRETIQANAAAAGAASAQKTLRMTARRDSFERRAPGSLLTGADHTSERAGAQRRAKMQIPVTSYANYWHNRQDVRWIAEEQTHDAVGTNDSSQVLAFIAT
jgi:hypothetical protein